jgi:hypothetical protein
MDHDELNISLLVMCRCAWAATYAQQTKAVHGKGTRVSLPCSTRGLWKDYLNLCEKQRSWEQNVITSRVSAFGSFGYSRFSILSWSTSCQQNLAIICGLRGLWARWEEQINILKKSCMCSLKKSMKTNLIHVRNRKLFIRMISTYLSLQHI